MDSVSALCMGERYDASFPLVGAEFTTVFAVRIAECYQSFYSIFHRFSNTTTDFVESFPPEIFEISCCFEDLWMDDEVPSLDFGHFEKIRNSGEFLPVSLYDAFSKGF